LIHPFSLAARSLAAHLKPTAAALSLTPLPPPSSAQTPIITMLATSGGFVAICPKKEVELGADKLIHRADHAEELLKEIEFPCSKAVTNQYAHLCGGALRAINPNSSMTMAEHDTCAAVFKG
jgi:hypothetical protein